MNKPLHSFFTQDHHRLEVLLDKATSNPGEINLEYFHQFRSGLLRHIKMEEKILFPAASKVNREVMKQIMPRFRQEHGALTALLVPPPTQAIIKVIRYVLEKHDFAEEKEGGLYEVCERLTKEQTQKLLDELAITPEVPTNPLNPAPIAIESAKRALARANYDFDEIVKHTP